MNNQLETLKKYEELKALFMAFVGSKRKMKKVLNKSPKEFIRYVENNFIVCERWACVVEDLEEQSTFISAKETKEQAEKLADKFRVLEKNALIIKVEINKYLKLK